MSFDEVMHVKPSKSLVYEPQKWNVPEIMLLRNCFAYVLNEPAVGFPSWYDLDNKKHGGNDHVFQIIRDWQKSCRGFVSRGNLSSLFAMGVLQGAGFESITEEQAHSKAALAEHIFAFLPAFDHVIRRDHDGTWSHKLGRLFAVNCDDTGQVIRDLREAKWRYSDAIDWDWNFIEKPFQRYARFGDIKAPDRRIQSYRIPQEGVNIKPSMPSIFF